MPSAAILPASLAIPRPSNRSLCSCRVLSSPYQFSPLSVSSVTSFSYLASPFIIRMGGGPRTFPGGVSKWQWKRMQAKKAKQLLKARLCRERQLYEMRKRAELKSAISELERPWEVVERAPVLFSASADEQVKVLADRFLRPSGFDMWSERDGPQLFRSPDNLPSARFFPKGALHSVKPYGLVAGELADGVEGEDKMRFDNRIARGAGVTGRGRGRPVRRVLSDLSSMESERSVPEEGGNGDAGGNRGSYGSDSEHIAAGLKAVEDEMPGGFGPHRKNHGSDSEVAIAGSRMNGDEMAVPRGRRVRRVLSDSSSLESEVFVPGKRGNVDARGNRVSYGSDSELVVAGSRKAEDEMAGGFGRQIRNRDSHGSDSELSLAGSRRDGDEITGDFGRRGGRGRNWGSRSSDSELADAGLRMERHDMAGGYGRRGGRGGRSGFRGSYRSYSDLAVHGLRMERDEMDGDFGRRGVSDRNLGSDGSNSKLAVTGSRMDRDEMSSGFGRRGGRGGNQFSYRSRSELPVTRSRMERDEIARGFGKRGGRGRNQSFYGSDSELAAAADSRKGRVDMASGFNRPIGGGRGRGRGYSYRGRVSLRPSTELILDGGSGRFEPAVAGSRMYGGRGGRSGYRGSYRSYSVLGSRIEGDKMGGDFGRRGDGDRNLGSYRSYSDIAAAGSRMDGGFGRRGGRGGNRGSYRSFSDLSVTRSSMEGDEIAGDFGKRGGRGGSPSFHGSDSELATADSRNGRAEMARGFNRPRGGGRDRGYSYGGRVSLRPSNESRLEEVGNERREPKRREGSTAGFRANRGRRSP